MGSKILCKLFAVQKSAKIDAQGMKGTWGDTRFSYCSLDFSREQYVHYSAKRGVAIVEVKLDRLGRFFLFHIRVPNNVPSMWIAGQST